MSRYGLTAEAVEDLKEIARYTFKTWGKTQSLRYANALEQRFDEIAKNTAVERSFSVRFPEIRVTRCEHHYIFFVRSEQHVP